MASTKDLAKEIATRDRSTEFSFAGMLLPNPDPILRAQGKSIATYRTMSNDALIGGCLRRRKSAVQALDWDLDKGKAASRTAKAIMGVFDNLDIDRITGQMLQATAFGYQPMEITWGNVGGLLVPTNVQAKPPEWFGFDATNQLRFKSRNNQVAGEELPARKFLLPRQDPSYENPYGMPDLSMCFWPLVFKKGGMKFWLSFVEKYGSAFSLGKLPRSATDTEKQALLDGLQALIQNGVATIPDDGSVELIEMAGKSASADLYERLVVFCRSEINIALLGQNQTTEASANKASAGAGLEVTKDLRDGDKKIVAAEINQLIRWIAELNFGGADVPVFSMWDQEEQDTLQAARDKSNYEAGARFTNAYFQRAYNYQEGDLLPPNTAAVTQGAAAFAESMGAPGVSPVANEISALSAAAAPAWSSVVDQVQTLVNAATSVEQLQEVLLQAYGSLDAEELKKVMAAAYALAELKGMDDATQSG